LPVSTNACCQFYVIPVNSITVSIHITADEYLKSYEHSQAVVIAVSEDGRRVRFPANLLKRFVTHAGIQGRFRIEFDSSGKCQQVVRLL